jgi:hypothetical protein
MTEVPPGLPYRVNRASVHLTASVGERARCYAANVTASLLAGLGAAYHGLVFGVTLSTQSLHELDLANQWQPIAMTR